MGNTTIQWCEKAWNPVTGCTKDRLLEPLSWRKPARVFVKSDIFHDDAPFEFIDEVFAVMALAPRHTFQIPTKCADRLRAHASSGTVIDRIIEQAFVLLGRQALKHMKDFPDLVRLRWPLSNVWLGVSVENQPMADKRIGELLQTPAAVRFISAEPLLDWLDLRRYLMAMCYHGEEFCEHVGCPGEPAPLHWVIVGGESGPKARPCAVAWIRSIVQQCQSAGVPVFVKQLGANVRDRNDAGFTGDFDGSGACWPEQHDIDDRIEHDLDGTRDGYQGAPVRIHLLDRKGGDMAEWPEDLRVREFPARVR